MTRAMDQEVITAQATLRKALERRWRHWTALIAELDAEIQAAAQESDPVAALFDAPPPARAALPLGVRKQLLAVFDARLHVTQAEAEAEARRTGAEPPDVEEVRRRLVAQIGRELRGEVHPKGMALVEWEGRLAPFDHRALQRPTTPDDYLAAGFGARRNRRVTTVAVVVASIGGIVLLLAGFVTMLLRPTVVVRSERAAHVGNQVMQRWDARAAGGIPGVVLRTDPERVSYPLVICATGATADQMLGATVVITGTDSLRRYTVDAHGADLRVVACNQPDRDLVRGTLVEAMTAVPGDPSWVRDVWVRGPAMDPARIPADRMEVVVLLDPAIGEPRLVLADGAVLAPFAQQRTDLGLEAAYLAPLASAPQHAGLYETVIGDLPRVVPIMIPAPEDRLSYLARALAVQAPQAVRDGTQVVVTLTLTTRVREPVPLLESDVTAMVGDRPVMPVWTPVTVPGGGASARLTIAVGAAAEPSTITVGAWRVQLDP